MPPVIDRLRWQLVAALDHADMFAQDVDRKYFRMVLRDNFVRRAISRMDRCVRNVQRRIMLKNAMSITPMSPAAKGKVSHGSVLNENNAPTRVTSGWKSTTLAPPNSL